MLYDTVWEHFVAAYMFWVFWRFLYCVFSVRGREHSRTRIDAVIDMYMPDGVHIRFTPLNTMLMVVMMPFFFFHVAAYYGPGVYMGYSAAKAFRNWWHAGH